MTLPDPRRASIGAGVAVPFGYGPELRRDALVPTDALATRELAGWVLDRSTGTVHGMDQRERVDVIATALSIPTTERHLFLCADQTTAKCAPVSETREVWRHVKSRLRALGVVAAPPSWHGDPDAVAAPAAPGGGTVLRTKVDCLRVCEMGPIAVVYPDGTWYHSVTIDVADRIIDEHLIGGRPVTEYVFAHTGEGRSLGPQTESDIR